MLTLQHFIGSWMHVCMCMRIPVHGHAHSFLGFNFVDGQLIFHGVLIFIIFMIIYVIVIKVPIHP